ncbi:gas vesicle protein GvpO [Arthrobacter sp. H14]
MAKKPAGSRVNAARAALEAMSQLEELTNRDAEGVVGVEKNEDGN